MNNANALLEATREEATALTAVPVVVVISTQYRENYGAHDWDGNGVCPSYWKCKGGSTYIVEGFEAFPDLIDADSEDILAKAMVQVSDAIEYSDHGSEEYILGASVVRADRVSECHEPWETPTYIKAVDGSLECRQTVLNDKYGYLRAEVERIEKTWKMDRDGNRSDFHENVVYR